MKKKTIGIQYPILGEPRQLFDGDNVYVVHERAEVGKLYSFICPCCHTVFISKTDNDEVVKIKCPDCNSYICFSSQGKPGNAEKGRTQIINDSRVSLQDEGVLVWNCNGQAFSYVLMPGETTIGRADNDVVSDISIDDNTASRRSVKIIVTRGEQTGRYIFKLVVLRTTNAVYVNQNALYTDGVIYLNYGDTIKIGETILTLLPNKCS